MTVTFSVIVSTYNHAFYLPKALESIKRQTCKDYEILVIDSSELLAINQSFTTARNKAIARSKGKLIAFLEDNTQWRSDYLQVMAQALLEHPSAILAYCHYQALSPQTNQDQEVRALPQQQDLVEAMLTDNFIHTISSVVFRRCLFDQVGLFDDNFLSFSDRFSEGEFVNREFYLRAFNIGQPVIVPLCLVRKGVDDLNLAEDRNSKNQDEFLTRQQQQQFNQVIFNQQLIKKNLVNKSGNGLYRSFNNLCFRAGKRTGKTLLNSLFQRAITD